VNHHLSRKRERSKHKNTSIIPTVLSMKKEKEEKERRKWIRGRLRRRKMKRREVGRPK